jgi:hypothetical protein
VIGAESVPVASLLREESLLLDTLVELQPVPLVPPGLRHQVVTGAEKAAGTQTVRLVAIVERAELYHIVDEVDERFALLVLKTYT